MSNAGSYINPQCIVNYVTHAYCEHNSSPCRGQKRSCVQRDPNGAYHKPFLSICWHHTKWGLYEAQTDFLFPATVWKAGLLLCLMVRVKGRCGEFGNHCPTAIPPHIEKGFILCVSIGMLNQEGYYTAHDFFCNLQ